MDKPKPTIPDDLDVNHPDFYARIQSETDSDKAKMLATLEIIKELRIEAAELEVETAALYHAELWYAMQDLKTVVEKK